MLWVNLVLPHMPKHSRYTIGVRVENKFLDLLERLYIAYFTDKDHKLERVTNCVLALDALKFLASIAWEAKFVSHAHFEQVAVKLEETGKMLGGWKRNLEETDKKNRHR